MANSRAIFLSPPKRTKWLQGFLPVAVRTAMAKLAPAPTLAIAPAPSATAGQDFSLISAKVDKHNGTVVLTGKAPTSFPNIHVEWPDGSKTDLVLTRTSDYWTITSDSTQPNGTIKVQISDGSTDGSTTIDLECPFTAGVPAAPSELRIEDDAQHLAVVSGRCTSDAVEAEVTWPNCLGTAMVIPDAEGQFRAVAPRRTYEGVVTVRARGSDGRWGILSSIPYPGTQVPKKPWDVRVVDHEDGKLVITGKADASHVEVLLPDETVTLGAVTSGTFKISPPQAQRSGNLRLTAIDTDTLYRSATVEVPYVDVRPTSKGCFRADDKGTPACSDGGQIGDDFWVRADAEGLKITVTFVDGRVESKLAKISTTSKGDKIFAARFHHTPRQAGLITAHVEDASGNLSSPATLLVTTTST